MVYRYPLEIPVQTSFGFMQDRPMVVVKLISENGITGWGEIWCNFPSVGAEHRGKLVKQVFAPLLLEREFDNAESWFTYLTRSTWILGLQSGEQGPLAHCIAGINIALCDIESKETGLPLWKFFGGTCDKVPVYASGINPTRPEEVAGRAVDLGYRAIKLKIGFGQARDLENLRALKQVTGSQCQLLADANQAWSLEDAMAMLDPLSEFDLGWLEEPISTDRPPDEWRAIKELAGFPLAAGENIQGIDGFDSVLNSDILTVVQPDIAKWGGLSMGVPLGKKVLVSNKRFCPHYLGGGIGLVASAHALAAVGGNGLLEVDINPNPLRSELVGDLLTANVGQATIGFGSGLGYEPELSLFEKYRIL